MRDFAKTERKKVAPETELLNVLMFKEKWTKTLYALMEPSDTSLVRKIQKWEADIVEVITHKQFEQAFTNIYLTPNIPKYHSFQYRLLHRAIITNVNLHRWGIRQTDECSFCEKYVETYHHLFWECGYIQELWNMIPDLLNDLQIDAQITLSYRNIVFNTVNNDAKSVVNFICLLLKQYVYRQRCLKKKLVYAEFKKIVLLSKSIERQIAVKNGKMIHFTQKWSIANTT